MIQSYQEHTGIKSTGVPASEGREERYANSEKAAGMALDLAETKGGLPDFEATFILARRLRRLAGENPEQFEGAVALFCEKTGRPFEEFWYAFLVSWPKVRFGEGEDVLTWAYELGKEEPYTPAPCLGRHYQTVASIAWHLARQAGGKPFWLPRVRIAAVLGVSANTVSDIVTLLEKNGVVKCVDPNYSYLGKKAKEYVFTGPPAVAHRSETAA